MAPLSLELDEIKLQENDIKVEEVDNFEEPGQKKNIVLKDREKYGHKFSNQSSIGNELWTQILQA